MKKIDFTGQIIDRLSVLEERTDGWLCRCSCGKLVTKSRRYLRLKRVETKSCGCAKKEKSIQTLAKTWGSNKLDFGESSLNKLIYTYKRHAKIRGLSWALSKDECRKLFSSNCFYCNSTPSSKLTSKNYHGHIIYNGIDRKNSSKGYLKHNCVPCCKNCNRAKSDLSEEQFYLWITGLILSSDIKPFYVYRLKDVSGVSGEGVIAEGAILPSGKVILEWLGKYKTDTIFKNLEEMQRIHGHEGNTVVILGSPKFHYLNKEMEKYIRERG